MDNNRFPYGSPRDQPRQPPPGNGANPMELEEALYFQRRQELQRDLQLRQMLLQGQIDRQQNIHQQRMYELQHQQALANLQRDEQAQIQDQLLRRRQLGLQQHAQQMQRPPLNMSGPIGSPSPIRRPSTRETMLADSLTSNATRRPPAKRKRAPSDASNGAGIDAHHVARRPRKDPFASSENHSDALLLAEASMENMNTATPSDLNSKPRAKPSPAGQPQISEEAQAVEAFKALSEVSPAPTYEPPEKEIPHSKGTIQSLIEAGRTEEQLDDAATVLVTLQDVGELSESEAEDYGLVSGDEDSDLAGSIILPGFRSKLPQLPIERVPPEKSKSPEKKADDKTSPLKKSPEKKTGEEAKKDDDTDTAKDDKKDSPSKKDAEATKASPSAKKDSPKTAKENGDKVKESEVIQPIEYPYPVDTWWPSITTIRRERKTMGEDFDDENFVEEPGLFAEGSNFRADVRRIQSRLKNDVQPGVLEKIPHCKIHRLKVRSRKGFNIPDHAFCWQVPEAFCNDTMVCCSICSTWRHASCGGHYKPYSVRDIIESKEPFVPVCDLCHEEQTLLQDFPTGQARLERQRIEQLRRALSTSAIIRQAAFVKYGGTYKWPLGSVSCTHIGGHTRSVHSRYDKAEKTWTEMMSRLSRGPGYRPKERMKVRTREFERLLMCVEDSEALMDRHNMIQFLQNDTRRKDPAGYEKHLRNIFDPDDDEQRGQGDEIASAPSQESLQEEPSQGLIGRRPPTKKTDENTGSGSQTDEAICARKGCCKKPRFDSIFCSDSCGVLELERDLLRAMYLAEETHPSMMRT